MPGLTLYFPADSRPTANDVVRLVREGPLPILPFTVSHDGEADAGRLELLAQGLAFDLEGLAPGAEVPPPVVAHRYGFEAGTALDSMAAIRLKPGVHLRGAENLVPVVRTIAGIGAGLATLPATGGVAWGPARAAVAVRPFIRAVATWLDGGAFPVLGLTALVEQADGAFTSEGLSFFTGQELWLGPVEGRSARDSARIAVRLVDALVGAEPVRQATRFIGPNGEALVADSTSDSGIVRIRSVE